MKKGILLSTAILICLFTTISAHSLLTVKDNQTTATEHGPANTSEDEFSGGTGSAEDPFLISTPEQLNNIRNYLGSGNSNKHFKLTDNIDLDVAPWNTGEGWLPIGNESPVSEQFTGTFDGSEKTIFNLFINRPTRINSGLFGFAAEATFKNITLENVNVTVGSRSGALVGRINGGRIENCHVSGNVKGGQYVGGLAGYLNINSGYTSGVTVFRCSSSTDVEAASIGGSLVGFSYNKCTIDQSFATGNVTSGSEAGGLVGSAISASVIRDSYATGNCIAPSDAGGLVGLISNSTITNCYSTGTILNDSDFAGLVGNNNNNSSTANHSYWNIETSSKMWSQLGEGKNTAQMIKAGTFIDWDFTSTWNIDEDTTYPYLHWQGEPGDHNLPSDVTPPTFVYLTPGNHSIHISWFSPSTGNPDGYNIYRDNEFLVNTLNPNYLDSGLDNFIFHTYYVTTVIDGIESIPSHKASHFANPGLQNGEGTEANPYLISTIEELFMVRLYRFSYFSQTNALDFDNTLWSEGQGWIPIGSEKKTFRGKYNGNNYTISNLMINQPDNNFSGLFGNIEHARIENITLTNVDIVTRSNSGALAGTIDRSQLHNINASGKIIGDDSLGGVFGTIMASTQVVSCTFSGEVSGNISIGGLAGSFSSGLPPFIASSITQSRSYGLVNGGYIVGGLIGGNGGTISSCYSSSNVLADNPSAGSFTGNSAGGLTGHNSGLINNSYATGSVTGTTSVGGLTGRYHTNGNITNCYAIGLVTASDETLSGGLIGNKKDAGIPGSYWDVQTTLQPFGSFTHQMVHKNNFANWDFEQIWSIEEGVTYPKLAWQTAAEPFNFAQQGFTVTFTVLDNEENPVSNAVILLNGTGFSAGDYTITHLNNGNYAYVVSAEGYHSASGAFNILDQDTGKTAILIPNISNSINTEKLNKGIFPNPFNEKLYFEEALQMKHVLIRNIAGQIVLQSDESLSISTGHLPEGIYIIEVITEHGDVITNKMIKQNRR